jgi:hypothetical protein
VKACLLQLSGFMQPEGVAPSDTDADLDEHELMVPLHTEVRLHACVCVRVPVRHILKALVLLLRNLYSTALSVVPFGHGQKVV